MYVGGNDIQRRGNELLVSSFCCNFDVATGTNEHFVSASGGVRNGIWRKAARKLEGREGGNTAKRNRWEGEMGGRINNMTRGRRYSGVVRSFPFFFGF